MTEDGLWDECTCGSQGWDSDAHRLECELQDSMAFVDGDAAWSPTLHKLIDVHGGGTGNWQMQTSDYDQLGYMHDAKGPTLNSHRTSNSWAKADWESIRPLRAQRCEHLQDEYVFSNGAKIYLSAGSEKQRHVELPPDIHIMLASAQRPIGVAWFVDWPDYGLPTMADKAMWGFVADVGQRVSRGERIEVGCMAAHGRTGTFVGLIEYWIMDQGRPNGLGADLMPAEDMIERIREKHCRNAVEGDKQQWYLTHYRAHLLGEPSPEFVGTTTRHENAVAKRFEANRGATVEVPKLREPNVQIEGQRDLWMEVQEETNDEPF